MRQKKLKIAEKEKGNQTKESIQRKQKKKNRPRKLIHSCVLPLRGFSSAESTSCDSITGKSMSIAIFDLTLNENIVCLTIWSHLFREIWLVNIWFFAQGHQQRAVTYLENVRQLNIRRGKNLGFQLSHRQPWKDEWTFGWYCILEETCWTRRTSNYKLSSNIPPTLIQHFIQHFG